jgi:hypothetical protein
MMDCMWNIIGFLFSLIVIVLMIVILIALVVVGILVIKEIIASFTDNKGH